MITAITKTYDYQIKRDHYIIFGHPTFKNTNIFHEYYDVIMKCPDVNRLGLIEMIETFKPLSKASICITYGEDKIEFFKPNKYIFPEFYIEFKRSKIVDFLLSDESGQLDHRTYIGEMDDYKELSDGKGSLLIVKKRN